MKFLNIVLSILLILPTIILAINENGLGNDQTKATVDTKFYLLKNDLRMCLQPNCGGFNLSPLNNDQGEDNIYVSEALVDTGLDFKLLQGETTENELMLESSVIISGTIKNSQTYPGFQCIHISDIFKAMQLPEDYIPNSVPENGNGIRINSNMVRAKPSFYMMKPSSLMCIRMANCLPIKILRLNTDEIQSIQNYTEPYSNAVSLIDKVWFTTRLVSNVDNIAIVKGVQMSGTLMISKVFINTRDPKTHCKRTTSNCDHSLGLVPVFSRDTDRCPVFDTCVSQGPCHLMIPHCQDGYQLASILSGPKACNKWYCDPEFLSNTNQNSIHYIK